MDSRMFNFTLKLTSRRISEERAWRVLHHLTKAIAFLHEKERTYMDIKPSNLAIVNNVVKLIDITELPTSEHGHFAFTLTYLPPGLLKIRK